MKQFTHGTNVELDTLIVLCSREQPSVEIKFAFLSPKTGRPGNAKI